MGWVKVLEKDQLTGDERRVIDLKGHKVLVLRHKGQVYAMLSRCPHMGAPLKRGRITENHEIVCPLHRSVFSMESGEIADWSPWPPVIGKAMGQLRQENALRVFRTKEENEAIWIDVVGE